MRLLIFDWVVRQNNVSNGTVSRVRQSLFES